MNRSLGLSMSLSVKGLSETILSSMTCESVMKSSDTSASSIESMSRAVKSMVVSSSSKSDAPSKSDDGLNESSEDVSKENSSSFGLPRIELTADIPGSMSFAESLRAKLTGSERSASVLETRWTCTSDDLPVSGSFICA